MSFFSNNNELFKKIIAAVVYIKFMILASQTKSVRGKLYYILHEFYTLMYYGLHPLTYNCWVEYQLTSESSRLCFSLSL